MTIDNLFVKVRDNPYFRKLYSIKADKYKNENFNNIDKSEQTAIDQLKDILEFAKNLDILRDRLKKTKKEPKVEPKEIVVAVDAANVENWEEKLWIS